MNIIDKAKKYAQEKHKGQIYRGKDFYKSHPLLVYKILKLILPEDENIQIAGLLHDTIEDCPTVTYTELVNKFGEDVADLVAEVTKEGYNYFPHLKTRRGVILKFADRLANISSKGGDWSEKKQDDYVFQKSKFWKS